MTTAIAEADTTAAEFASNVEAAQFDVTTQDAVITIENKATGKHRTFRVRTIRKGNLEGKRVVSLLVGSDNTEAGDWQGFGFADQFGVKVWAKCKGQGGERSDFEVFARMLENPSKFLAKGAAYHVATTCLRCGRTLTTPESVAARFGPECIKKGL